VTPARYVESVRLEAARQRLEESTEPVQSIARACGFGSAESMRRSFLRTLHVGPSEYRRRFHSSFAASRRDRGRHAQSVTGEPLQIKKRRNP
jgi:transcriptional regulator GlxA family with amidase domain